MTNHGRHWAGTAVRGLRGLRGLRQAAPATLLPATLASAGLVDRWAEIEGPLGPLVVAWGAQGVTAVERAGDAGAFELAYAIRHGRAVVRMEPMPVGLERQVRRRLAGQATRGPAIDLGHLTAFEQSVLRKTMEIPFGETRPYAWVAREIGRPRAVRAVGSALGANPVPFVIPCHRVVRSDGRIGEYGAGGPEAKRAVLRGEGVDPSLLERLADQGVRYVGSGTTGVFCYPSCRHARRISGSRRVVFRDGAEALDAGFRPCRACRPVELPVFDALLKAGPRPRRPAAPGA
jgi:O-6-methylguanine DNA methyltransferase